MIVRAFFLLFVIAQMFDNVSFTGKVIVSIVNVSLASSQQIQLINVKTRAFSRARVVNERSCG